MAENKTHATAASVDDFIAAIADNDRREDCLALVVMMQRVAGCTPYMFGPTIIGFGKYHYKYESGHEGDACITGFASRKPDITLSKTSVDYVRKNYPDKA